MTSKSNRTNPNWLYVHFLREVIRLWLHVPAKDGSWIPSQEVLELTIPPWIGTWWFIPAVLVLTAAAIIETFRRTLKRKEEKLKWAMKEHEQQVYEADVSLLISVMSCAHL